MCSRVPNSLDVHILLDAFILILVFTMICFFLICLWGCRLIFTKLTLSSRINLREKENMFTWKMGRHSTILIAFQKRETILLQSLDLRLSHPQVFSSTSKLMDLILGIFRMAFLTYLQITVIQIRLRFVQPYPQLNLKKAVSWLFLLRTPVRQIRCSWWKAYLILLFRWLV